jgi:hypothetical protein
MIGVGGQSSLSPMSVRGASAEIARITARRIPLYRPRALLRFPARADIADHGRLLMLNCRAEPGCRG